MRFALFGFALCATVNALPQPQDTSAITGLTNVADTNSLVPDTGSLVPRQDHPAGPGQKALIKLLGKDLYHEISLDLHHVGIAVAHLEQEIDQLTISLDPSVGDAIRSLLQQVDTLEADLVSVGFNT